MTANPPDEFDALKTIAETLKPFNPDDQSRMLRWISEKLGVAVQVAPLPGHVTASLAGASPGAPGAAPPQTPSGTVDIKTFVASKQPKNDTQFATVVAYFYRFEARDKKDSISADDLIEACRLANYERLLNPGQTLLNSVRSGLLDKSARGVFSINSVGENLVAITLPSDGNLTAVTRRRRNAKPAAKKAAGKNAISKKAAAPPKKK